MEKIFPLGFEHERLSGYRMSVKRHEKLSD